MTNKYLDKVASYCGESLEKVALSDQERNMLTIGSAATAAGLLAGGYFAIKNRGSIPLSQVKAMHKVGPLKNSAAKLFRGE